MKSLRLTTASLALFAFASTGFAGAITTVSFDSGSREIHLGTANGPLVSSGQSTAGDGAVLQLGYFDASTVGAPFAGNWIPMTGIGSLNTAFASTSVGDDADAGAGPGTFALQLSFDDAVQSTFQRIPAAGTRLAIRIYAGRDVSPGSFFETFTSSESNWLWKAPGVPPSTVALSFDDPNLRIQSSNSPAPSGNVVIPVPEPSSALLMLAGAIGLVVRRRA